MSEINYTTIIAPIVFLIWLTVSIFLILKINKFLSSFKFRLPQKTEIKPKERNHKLDIYFLITLFFISGFFVLKYFSFQFYNITGNAVQDINIVVPLLIPMLAIVVLSIVIFLIKKWK